MRGVADAELEWIDAALIGEFIDDGLAGEGRGRRTGRAIGGDLRPINYNVEGINSQILDDIRSECGHRAGREWRTRKCAGLVCEPDLRRSDFAVAGGAHFNFHP